MRFINIKKYPFVDETAGEACEQAQLPISIHISNLRCCDTCNSHNEYRSLKVLFNYQAIFSICGKCVEKMFNDEP